MLPQDSCPAPPPPPGAPSDWTGTVDPNCFSNIQRLAQWIGKTNTVPPGTSPATSFEPVAPGSLGGGETPPPIYVVTHGWAPGYRAVVNQYGGKLLWWSDDAAVQNVWASYWAWSPVFHSKFPINSNGFLPSIAALDPSAIILAYSWIDNSATDSGFLDLTEVYRSEAHTHLNGLRLANALQQAIAGSFWTAGGVLRLIGHSHGSKVATVAALTLQQRGLPVAQLTILDAPESEVTLIPNGANLLGFYLEQMKIMHPFFTCASGAFIDNYASCFGVGYDGAANLKNIVEVALDPDELYWPWELSERHAYAAAWYGGAAAGATTRHEPRLGLAWPPPPNNYSPALQQNWPGGKTEASQWSLAVGRMSEVFVYGTQPVSVATVGVEGNVKVDSSGNITFGPAGNWPDYSIFQGSYQNNLDSDNYGIAFDLRWTNPTPDDYFVVAMESDLCGQEVLFVLEGQSFSGGEACSEARTSPAINCDASGSSLSIYIYFLAAEANLSGQVEVSNFRFVVVGSASGYLRACRLAAAAERLAQRQATAPQTARSLAMASAASPRP